MPLPQFSSRDEILAHWQAVKAGAPYRASVDLDAEAEWMADGALPRDLAEAALTVGRRRIFAFRHREVRDFFVEANLEKGTRAEPDGADLPSSDATTTDEPEPITTLEEAIATNLIARKAKQAAEERVCSAFIAEAEGLLAQGRVPEALGIVRTLPSYAGVMRIIVLEKAVDAGWEPSALPLLSVVPTPLTAERGQVLFEVERAKRMVDAAEEALSRLVKAPLKALIEAKNLEEAESLVEQIKPSMAAAFANDALWDLRKERKAAQEAGPDEPTSVFAP